MGWDFGEKPQNVKQYLNDNLTWSTEEYSNRVLDSAIVSMADYYAVCERTYTNGRIEHWMAVSMIRFTRDSMYNFGKKDMTESMLPCITRCPQKLLNMIDELSPIETGEDGQSSKGYAAKWRLKCRSYHAQRALARTVKHGYKVKFSALEGFYEVVKSGRRTYFRDDSGCLFNVQGWRNNVSLVSQ